ncbi:MAG: putative secreted hydrolase [Gammaproteobacteria bacterium]
MRRGVVVLLLLVTSALVACEQSGPASAVEATASHSEGIASGRAAPSPIAGALGGAVDVGYARADSVRALQFPADHGSHPDFRSEWWYFTGNLLATNGRRFGFQLTLFRRALAPASGPTRASRFATRQAWMGHFALSDVDANVNQSNQSQSKHQRGGGQFYAFERLERGAAGLAGARAQPFKIWLRDWQVSGAEGSASPEPFPLHVHAAESGIELDLRLERGKAKVLQGEAGLSRKNAEPGNASYYYSYTRMPAAGRVRTANGEFQVSGLAWLDREWSSSALSADQVGWDWFALHLNDGRDLMLYRLRNQRGETHPFSAGVLVAANGTKTSLAVEQISFEPGRLWRSAHGAQYPVVWKLRAGTLQLQVTALFDAQAHRGRLRYWEGAVRARGSDGTHAVSASGYLEMTGY